jgi:opacity protein-like surface antigen
MKKIILMMALIGATAAGFAAGKDIGGGGDRREENRDDGKNQGKGKDIGGPVRAKGKDIAPPRRPPHQPSHPRPQPVIVHPHPRPRTVIVTRPAPAPVVIHHNSVVTTASPTVVAVAETSSPAPVRMPESDPIREYWHESAYLGLELHLGNGRYNQNGYGKNGWLDENYSPFGGGFAFSAGYKIPYFRFGGEIGFSSFRADVTPPPFSGYKKEEDSFSAFTIMPHVFLDIDIPGVRVAPYVGFAGGFGVVTATYDLFAHSGSSPYETISASNLDFVYAALAGLRIALTPRTELAVGYRFQDYGSVKVDKYENKVRGHSFNLGLTFRL